jgi:hypothetical protein
MHKMLLVLLLAGILLPQVFAFRLDPSGQVLSDLRPVYYYQPVLSDNFNGSMTTSGYYGVSNQTGGYPTMRFILDDSYAPATRYQRQNYFSNSNRYSYGDSYYSNYDYREGYRYPVTNSSEITVYSNKGSCSPSELMLAKNRSVTIRFVNNDDVVRYFSIPGMGIQTPRVLPEDSHVVYMKTPNYSRTYRFNCD